jgi:SAM-dependent methyltransferase
MDARSPQLEPEVVPACPVCGERRFDPLLDERGLAEEQKRLERFHRRRLARRRRGELAERASFTQGYATGLVRCSGCGLLLRSPRPRSEDVERAYTEERYPAERLEEMRAAQVDSFRDELLALRALGAQSRILEVGSFLGGFLELARKEGWDAVGLDPGVQMAERCRARGLRVIESTLEDHVGAVGEAGYDCVAIWNTFDQLPEPKPTLAAAARVLRPGGVLALRVPHGRYYRALRPRLDGGSAASRYASEARLAWNNLLSFPYLHGYDVDTLDRLVTPFGFVRALAQGGVLCRIAGRATARWARAEERLVKAWQLRVARREPRAGWIVAPWLDVYYRRSA